jgi:hypothetical protein
MSYFGHFELVAEPATPVHYGIDDGQEGYIAENYDPDTGSDQIGSNAELGGEEAESATYDLYGMPINDTTESSIVGTNTVNLTGMSESPMTPVDTDTGVANINGSGQAGQQIFTRNPANSWISQTFESLARGLSRHGQNTTTITQAGAPTTPVGVTTPPVLQQTGIAGISLHGNLVLFFIIGAVIAVIVFD